MDKVQKPINSESHPLSSEPFRFYSVTVSSSRRAVLSGDIHVDWIGNGDINLDSKKSKFDSGGN
jgi:hypothetical protein